MQKARKLDDNPLAPLALEAAKIDAESQESSYSFPESKGLTGVYSGFKDDGPICAVPRYFDLNKTICAISYK